MLADLQKARFVVIDGMYLYSLRNEIEKPVSVISSAECARNRNGRRNLSSLQRKGNVIVEFLFSGLNPTAVVHCPKLDVVGRMS